MTTTRFETAVRRDPLRFLGWPPIAIPVAMVLVGALIMSISLLGGGNATPAPAPDLGGSVITDEWISHQLARQTPTTDLGGSVITDEWISYQLARQAE